MSPQTRIRAIVAAAALAAAGIAAGVAAVSRGEDAPPAQAPPLELGIALLATPLDEALVGAERAYDSGDREAAGRLFASVLASDADSVEAQVGAALAAWPEGTVERLRGIANEHPRSAVARLHLGLALLVDGDEAGAEEEWRAAKRVDPDTTAALRAEDLLHPEMPPGRPFFTPGGAAQPAGIEDLGPQEQVDELRRRAEAGGVVDWLLYGSVLQRLGRSLSAQAAFDRAVEIDPGSLEARTAAAVARFDKDDPSAAFSRLGPLASANPDAAVVHYHLGLMLLWLQQVDEARAQLERARDAEPDSVYGTQARDLLARLDEAAGG